MSASEFEAAVAEALDTLPPHFQELLENVAVVVEDEPWEDDLDEVDLPENQELLGIFRGIARTHQSWEALPHLPHQIAIFRGPILRISETRAEALAEIRDTVVHELGHFFGLDDHEMPY